jgi:hypothetical protein
MYRRVYSRAARERVPIETERKILEGNIDATTTYVTETDLNELRDVCDDIKFRATARRRSRAGKHAERATIERQIRDGKRRASEERGELHEGRKRERKREKKRGIPGEHASATRRDDYRAVGRHQGRATSIESV